MFGLAPWVTWFLVAFAVVFIGVVVLNGRAATRNAALA